MYPHSVPGCLEEETDPYLATTSVQAVVERNEVCPELPHLQTEKHRRTDTPDRQPCDILHVSCATIVPNYALTDLLLFKIS